MASEHNNVHLLVSEVGRSAVVSSPLETHRVGLSSGNTPGGILVMPATTAVRARLCREALGWCAMPNCYTELRLGGTSVEYIAQAAHIVGENDGSARFDPAISLDARNRIDNLILMCPTHHAAIDAEVETWSVDRLRELKADHEPSDKQSRYRKARLDPIDDSPFRATCNNAADEIWLM